MPPCRNDPHARYKGDGSEPSPKGFGFCAHAEKEGTIMKGMYNKDWIVKRDVRGVLSWKRLPDKQSNKKKSTQKTNKRSTYKTSKRSTNKRSHTIEFLEPINYKPSMPRSISGGGKLQVSDALYRSILKGPIESKETNDSNGYIFGKKFPLSEYQLYASHYNDAAATGFVDPSLFDADQAPEDYDDELVLLEKTNYIHTPAYSRQVRKKWPWRIWTGETVGGDVGASLYVHMDRWNQIDSLIVDNDYYFPNQ